MTELYLSKAELRRDASASAIVSLLLPEDADQRLMVTHKLLWTLFADDADRKRDFLWREAAPGHFLILSERPPEDTHRLFRLSPPKVFAPALTSGDRLAFSLRVNPTIALQTEKNAKGQSRRADVVMHAIHQLPAADRAKARAGAIQQAGAEWLQKRCKANGFEIERVTADRYTCMKPPHRSSKMCISTLDLDGILHVTEPKDFTSMLRRGLGRAKAYGCGLMLIRRA